MTKALLEEGVDCTAIFAISDSLAIGAVRALIDAGKRVPMDISVAGFDGTEMAAYYNPSITTIRRPAETMARESAAVCAIAANMPQQRNTVRNIFFFIR